MSIPLFPEQNEVNLEERLRTIFRNWVEHRANSGSHARSEKALKEESATVYQEMWHAFAAFCAPRKLDLINLRTTDILAFLASRGNGIADPEAPAHMKSSQLTARYAWRMLSLIDRVTRFQAQHEDKNPNLAAQELLKMPEYCYANAAHKDTLPDYLCEADAKHLIAYLTGQPAAAMGASAIPWKDMRDRTAVALMLGAGLSPGDVRALLLGGVVIEGGPVRGLPWKLAVPGNGNAPARETPLAEWAAQQLAVWLRIRSEQQIEGFSVFPSTASGKVWSHTGCYEACRRVLEEAGLSADGGGVFKLRHTFALRQLSKGRTESEVAGWLGFVDPGSMARYRRIVQTHVSVD